MSPTASTASTGIHVVGDGKRARARREGGVAGLAASWTYYIFAVQNMSRAAFVLLMVVKLVNSLLAKTSLCNLLVYCNAILVLFESRATDCMVRRAGIFTLKYIFHSKRLHATRTGGQMELGGRIHATSQRVICIAEYLYHCMHARATSTYDHSIQVPIINACSGGKECPFRWVGNCIRAVVRFTRTRHGIKSIPI